MSRIYKSKQIILGDQKTIKIKRNPIIKSNEEKAEENIQASQEDKEAEQAKRELEDKEREMLYEKTMEEAKENAKKTIEEAEKQAEDIINQAKEEKEAMILNANESKEQIIKDAKDEGYSQGLLQGNSDGFKEMEKQIEEAKQIKENTLIEKKDTAKSLEKEMIQLVISSIKKIINYEIQEDHSLLLNLIEKGVEKSTYTESLTIRVSPEDYDIVNSSKNKIYMMTQGIDKIEIKNDPALEPNSIIIDTGSGTLNSSIETQIMQIEEKFNHVLKGEW